MTALDSISIGIGAAFVLSAGFFAALAKAAAGYDAAHENLLRRRLGPRADP